MNESEVMKQWEETGQLVVMGDDLRQTLLLLAKHGYPSNLVKYLFDNEWGIAKIY